MEQACREVDLEYQEGVLVSVVAAAAALVADSASLEAYVASYRDQEVGVSLVAGLGHAFDCQPRVLVVVAHFAGGWQDKARRMEVKEVRLLAVFASHCVENLAIPALPDNSYQASEIHRRSSDPFLVVAASLALYLC